MKRSFVFTLAQEKHISGLNEYAPPLINPDYNHDLEVVFDDKQALQEFTLLLAAYKRAGSEVAQHLRQSLSANYCP